jgi:flagellar biosynthetic protein FliR
MQDLVELLNQDLIYNFLLLFARILAFMAFMPIFSHKNISSTVRVALTFYVTIFLYPLIDTNTYIFTTDGNFVLAIISELTLGLVSSVFVQIIFSAVQIVGDLIGFATSLSMANMFDPATGTQQGIVSRFLYMIVLVLYFESGMYEVTLFMLSSSIGMIHLGEFNLYNYDGITMAAKEVSNMFLFAFSFSFPLFFIGFILDIYYSYGTKSMASFSPFVVTFQIKFTLIFLFLMFGLDIFVHSFETYFISKFQ